MSQTWTNNPFVDPFGNAANGTHDHRRVHTGLLRCLHEMTASDLGDAIVRLLASRHRRLVAVLRNLILVASWLRSQNIIEIGRDCIGAMQFLPPEDDHDSTRPLEGEELSEDNIEKRLAGFARKPLGMDKDEDFRISVTGAQEKKVADRESAKAG
ncbi:hypothetical protein [uncultured Parasphingorhabdus sp.]|uniref:hypothetical protein n=1 Tax=uncultured Parasphingorhabdus sp. TaxID=2709694 RepID=UPI0030D73BF2|tara:strand:- start:38712 stop:39176 length:465 start_codon:yes stop_codon:yes gene_type:complete